VANQTRVRDATAAQHALRVLKLQKPPKVQTPLKRQATPPTSARRWVPIVKWLAIATLAGIALMVSTIAFVFWMYGRDPNLPNIQKLSDYKPKQITTIMDSNDRRIGELGERRTFVPYDKIPPIVVDAFIAAEDNNFWKHGGVDYYGMVRAFFANLRAGHTKEGASTITQQVVKNFLLSNERSFKRKIQEIILARRLEHSLSKQDIMTLYLNQIYFGGRRYGVQEAARFYFGKDIGQVDIGEAAVLASMPKEPEILYHSLRGKNPAKIKDRQTYVLNQMAKLGMIKQAEAQKFIDAPIQVVKDPFPELGRAPEWVDLVKKELVRTGVVHDEAGIDDLGATVRTTLDPGLQKRSQEALQIGLRAIDKRHGIGRPLRTLKGDKIELELAKLAKRLPKDGPQVGKDVYEAIVTAVHDDDQELEVDLGHWQAALVLGTEEDARFNPDGKKPSERFKIGDVINVMVMPAAKNKADADADADEQPVDKEAKHAKNRVHFAPGPEGAVVIIENKTRKVRALVGGYSPHAGGFDRATMAKRQPGSSFKAFVYTAAIDSGKFTAASIVNDAPEVFDLWKPKNFESGTFEGPVTLRHALARSINTVSIRLTYEMKPENVAAIAHKMGVQSDLPAEMAIALGADVVTPLEEVNAYATLAAGGVAMPPRFVETVNGKPVNAPPGEQVLRPEVAYVVTDMMRSVVTEGTGHLAADLKIPIAGKTGTSNEARDTWFIGMTPDYTIGVWVGYDDDRPMGHEQGGTVATPVFVDIMRGMNQPAKQFPRPPHVVEATIDRQTGLLAPDGAPKGTTLQEVFIEGTQPTETAPKPGEVTEGSSVTGEYGD
jgi:penicillin-binding protein 1A